MLVRDLLLHLNNLQKLYKKAIIVHHKNESEYVRHHTLLENIPKSVYDYEVVEFDVWYRNITSTTKELDSYLTYKKGESEYEVSEKGECK